MQNVTVIILIGLALLACAGATVDHQGQEKAVILIGLALLACASTRATGKDKPSPFQHLKGWQKLLGVLAIVMTLLIILNPEFLALGLVGDTAFFDMLVLGISLQLQEQVVRIWHSVRTVLSRSLRWCLTPSMGKLNSTAGRLRTVLFPVVIVLLHLAASPAEAVDWGVNVHDGGSDPAMMASRLAERNLKSVRMDLFGNDPVRLAKFRHAAAAFNAKGIKIQAVIFTDFSARKPRNQDLAANPAEVEQTAYKQTKSQVEATKDLLHDFELGNETTLGTPHILADGATGQKATDFDTPSGRLQAAALRGMARAVHDVGNSSRLPLRVILGTVNRHWGFLAFMQQQGVLFDVIGYHIYPQEHHQPLDRDPWFGPGGLLGQLALFKKPITINEINAGEIYSGTPGHQGADYLNRAGDPVTEKGFKGLDKHLKEILHHSAAQVESILFYEVADEPGEAAPENRFGLYYDAALQQPKISLLLVTSYAGGTLSPEERRELTSRGIGGVATSTSPR